MDSDEVVTGYEGSGTAVDVIVELTWSVLTTEGVEAVTASLGMAAGIDVAAVSGGVAGIIAGGGGGVGGTSGVARGVHGVAIGSAAGVSGFHLLVGGPWPRVGVRVGV